MEICVVVMFPDGSKPKYSQLYVLDPVAAADARVESFDGLEHSLVSQLFEMLTEPVLHKDPWTGCLTLDDIRPRNPYPSHFCTMHALVQDHRSRHSTCTKSMCFDSLEERTRTRALIQNLLPLRFLAL